jgi:hypothetical protein
LQRAETPAALTAAITRMLAKQPDARFATTAELAVALDAIHVDGATSTDGQRQLREMIRAIIPATPPIPRPRHTPPAETTKVVAPPPAVIRPRPTVRPLPARRRKPSRWRAFAGVSVVVLLIGGVVATVAARRADTTIVVPRTSADMLRVGRHAYQNGDYELARRFFVRAVTLDSSDRGARSDLACALVKLGRRAGQHDCDVLADATPSAGASR